MCYYYYHIVIYYAPILSHFGSSLNKNATRSGGYCIVGHP